MVGNTGDSSISRRRLLRNTALLGTGVVTGGAAASESTDAAAASESTDTTTDQTRTGFLSVDSYRELFGSGRETSTGSAWDGTFTVKRDARSDDDEGVFIDVPPTCDGDGEPRRLRGYLITAAPGTSCSGGPSGEGPWLQSRCTWLFLDADAGVRFNDQQVVTNGRHHRVEAPCHDEVQPTDSDGNPVGAGFPAVRLTFTSLPEATEGDVSQPFSRP